MNFFKWIAHSGGPIPVSKILKEKPGRIRGWLRREGTPDYITMLKIKRASKGTVTIEDIVVETNVGRKKKNA